MSRALLAAIALACAAPARADVLYGGFNKPELRSAGGEFHPYAGFSEVYDSNIYRQRQPIASWIHAVDAGIGAGAAFSDAHRLDLSYRLGTQAYTKDPSVNNAFNQGAGFLYTYTGSWINARAKEDYLNTVDPPNTEQTARLRRWRNTVGLDAEYAPAGGKLTLGVDASQTTHKYVADSPTTRSLLNRYEQTAGLKTGYWIMPKTRAYVSYHRGVIHYSAATASPTKDSKSHAVAAGLEGELAAKVTARLEAGAVYRRYDDEPAAGAGRTVRSPTYAGSVAYSPLERTKLEAAASRSLEEATFANNRYYTATVGSLRATHAFPERFTLHLLGGVERDAFPEEATVAGVTQKRRDDFFQARAGLDYDVQDWLRLGVSHYYRARFSKNLSEQFAYRDAITTLSATVTF